MSAFPIRFGHPTSGSMIVRSMMRNQIKWAFRPRLWYRQVVKITDFTGAAATTQTLTLATLFPANVFPTDCDLMEGATVENLVLPVGVTTVTIQLGGTFDAGADPDGLLTVSNLLGGGAAVGDILQTPAAANYDKRYESAFVPECLLTTTGGNVADITAMEFEVAIPWSPRAERSG